MALAKRIEDLKDSAVLGRRTSVRLMELYVEEAMPEYKVNVLAEQDKRAFTIRVVFGNRVASMAFDFDATVFDFRLGIDRLMFKIQEELDEEPLDAGVHTSPKPGAYAPKVWAKKLAEQAMK